MDRYQGFLLTVALALPAGCSPKNTAAPPPPTSAVTPFARTTSTAIPPARLETGEDTSAEGEGFILTSPVVSEGGTLPAEYTCDGAAATLPLAWSGAPGGVQIHALVMHHVAGPEDVHWYWVLYNIPPDVTELGKNASGIGTLGTNSVNGRMEYAPPCSKGPGPKTYVYTVYALSAQPQFTVPPDQIDRDALLETIRSITLASAELHVVYTRS